MMPRTFRAAVIGSTGKGGFGHGLELAFKDQPNVELVAIADDDPKGLAAVCKRTAVADGYLDYREMLAKVKPDVVSIGPRWLDRRVEMATAVADAGCHIYCEKPFAATLTDVDAIRSAVANAGVKMALALPYRAMAPIQKVHADFQAGRFGRLVRMRGRPSDDHRGGGEELIVHGPHVFDLMIYFAGPPLWVSGHIAVGGRDATKADRHVGTEPIGPIAGDNISATFGFANGVHGAFDSVRGIKRPDRVPFGVALEFEEATVLLRSPGDAFRYPSVAIIPEQPKFGWEKVWIEDWHFHPDHTLTDTRQWIHRANKILARDLLDAVEGNREPLTSLDNASLGMEMIQGVYTSHFADGRRIAIPLQDRTHPLQT